MHFHPCADHNLAPAAIYPPPPPQDAAPALGGTSLASTGTYVGCVWSEYQVLQDNQRLKPSVASLTGSGLNFLVGRVSYTFGFQGEAAADGQGSLLPAGCCLLAGTDSNCLGWLCEWLIFSSCSSR